MPVAYPLNVAVFDRVVVNVIKMFRKIIIILNEVFPKTTLPNSGFAVLLFGGIHPLWVMVVGFGRF